jgi:hypothetical protein
MVCVPSRGAFSWVQLPRRRVHALRCPRSCRLARPSGRRCLPGPSSGRSDFQLRLRSRRSPRFSVPSQGGAGSSLGIYNLPWSRPSSGASPRRGSGLVPLGSAKHLPASHDVGFTALHPLSGSGKAVRLSCRSSGWIPCPVLGAFWLLRRSWCFPFAVSRSRLPAPARWVRCDAVLVTVNCLPMFLEGGMGLAEVAS